MNSVAIATIVSSFLASAVEVVEAVTIVLAVGTTRQWRGAWLGVLAAIVALALLIAVFGTAIAVLVPINVLRVVVGGFLVVYGLQWLTKAILRAGGARAKHDETAIYAAEVLALAAEPPVPATGIDWVSFTVAAKGVLLEGLEVAFIVVTFGASAGMVVPAAAGALAALVVVLAVAVVVHRPLAAVPENGLKFVVGIMLTAFGTFWAGEGIGVDWPGEDLAIGGLIVGFLVLALVGVQAVSALARSRSTRIAAPAETRP